MRGEDLNHPPGYIENCTFKVTIEVDYYLQRRFFRNLLANFL